MGRQAQARGAAGNVLHARLCDTKCRGYCQTQWHKEQRNVWRWRDTSGGWEPSKNRWVGSPLTIQPGRNFLGRLEMDFLIWLADIHSVCFFKKNTFEALGSIKTWWWARKQNRMIFWHLSDWKFCLCCCVVVIKLEKGKRGRGVSK